MLELENSLAEERRMQEEAAEEFDSMQQEVLHTRTKAGCPTNCNFAKDDKKIKKKVY